MKMISDIALPHIGIIPFWDNYTRRFNLFPAVGN
jgi:hypothetical protein